MPANALMNYSPEWPRWSGLLARLTCVLLAVWLLWLIVKLVLLLVSGPEVVLDAPAARQVRVQQINAPVEIANWHLFGRAAVSNPLNLAALPETPLNLELRGIVSGLESDQEGHAIIVDGSGRQWVYKVGDVVPGDATVKAITPEQVVLERNGQNEALSLPQRLNAASGAVANNQRRSALPGSLSGGSLVGGSPQQLTGLRGRPQQIAPVTIPGGLAGVQLDTANLQRLSQSVQVTPVSGGYKVFPGRNATVFKQLGLQANDVITAVNGRPLSDVQSAMQVFQNLGQNQAITLSVRRGNQVIQLQPDTAALGGQ